MVFSFKRYFFFFTFENICCTGEVGKQIRCLTNFIPIQPCAGWILYRYNVSFNPVISSKSIRLKLLNEHHEILGTDLIFDGIHLYISRRLAENPTVLTSINPKTEEQVQIFVQYVTELSSDSAECISLFNTINRKLFKL